MKTVAEIISAIEALPKPQLFEIVCWVEQKRDEIEDAADAAFVAALEPDNEPPIPWEEVQAKLGLKP